MASRVLVRSVGASASPLPRSISTQAYTPLRSFVPHSRGHTRLTPPSTRPPPSSSFSSSSFARSYSSTTPSTSSAIPKTSSVWTKVAIGGTIALATSATLLSQMSKALRMEGNNSSALSPLTGGNVIQDLKDENNRIAVEKKSTMELLRSMMVYKLCTFSLLVDLAPKLIHLAELAHLTAPTYWFIRKTFFAQFCG